MASKTTTDYEALRKTMQRQGVSPGVLLKLMKIAGRWAAEKRR